MLVVNNRCSSKTFDGVVAPASFCNGSGFNTGVRPVNTITSNSDAVPPFSGYLSPSASKKSVMCASSFTFSPCLTTKFRSFAIGSLSPYAWLIQLVFVQCYIQYLQRCLLRATLHYRLLVQRHTVLVLYLY